VVTFPFLNGLERRVSLRWTCLLGMDIGRLPKPTSATYQIKMLRLHGFHAADYSGYRFFFFPKMSFQLSL
jgi:hypothetical protein